MCRLRKVAKRFFFTSQLFTRINSQLWIWVSMIQSDYSFLLGKAGLVTFQYMTKGEAFSVNVNMKEKPK